jgi:hypothetical protein
MVKKFEKGTTAPKASSQHKSKPNHHKKEERNPMDERLNMQGVPT